MNDYKNQFEEILALVAKEKASDLHLSVGRHPTLRISGNLVALAKQPILTAQDISGIVFSIIAAIAFGLWTVFHDQAAKHVNSLLGAIIVSLTAVILGMFLLLPHIKTTSLVSNPKGIIFAVLAGICALAIDYFALKAYGTGIEVSIAGPIIIGGSIVVASTIGFFMGDSISIAKIVGLIFVIVGSIVLAVASK